GGETSTTTVADILEDRLGGEMTFTSDDYTVQGIALEADGETTSLTLSSPSAGLIYNPTQIADEDRSTVLYRHTASGLDLLESRQRDAARRAFGSWMKNASFAVITGVEPDPEFDSDSGIDGSVSYAYAAGDQTGSNLASYIGSATWEGVMVATTRIGDGAGHILQGDASLQWAGDDNTLDIAFANIVNIDREGADHTFTSFSFEDVPVAAEGTYAVAEVDGNGRSLAGAFYGPTHEEAAGIFEASGLVGSFGALQTEIETLLTDATPELLAAVGGETTTTTIADIQAARINSSGNFIDDDLSAVAFDRVDGAAYYVENKGEDNENVITFTSDSCTGESSSTTTLINCPLTGTAGAGDASYTGNAPYNPTLLTDENTSAVLYRHTSGLDLIESRQRDADRRAFGSWMEYASFAVITESEVVATTPATGPLTFAFAAGDATGSRPADDVASATWEGVMVATALTGDVAGNILQGGAELVYTGVDDGPGGSLDIDFTKIVNIDRDGAGHSVASVSFPGVDLETDGTYTVDEDNTALDGALYGPGHEEAAGFFEHSGLVGSFGARLGAVLTAEELMAAQTELARARTAIEAANFSARDTRSNYTVDIEPAEVVLQSGDIADAHDNDGSCNFVGGKFDHLNCSVGSDDSLVNLTADLRGGMPGALQEVSGVQITNVRGAGDKSDIRRYGAWMEHSGFYLYTGVPADVALNPQEAQTFAIVDRFGSRTPDELNVAGTYLGAMVGTPVRGQPNHGDVLVGDARLTYNGTPDKGVNINSDEKGNITLGFTNIVNVDNGTARPDISFEDLVLNDAPVLKYDGRGIYDQNSNYTLEGDFYGPSGEEVAGTFRRGGVVGAFGAKKQAE
ncbi:MAG: transferrin-binding protein-like solute binding protein, partial [Rhodobacteraceae bacterium]|nr:transferrin-binding protein-like solute binding protein [Paracoccaceae bacterium]